MGLTLETVAQGLVGLSEGESAILLEQHGYILRTIQIGDEQLTHTDDFNNKRVNVAVDNDHIVSKIISVG